MKQGYWPLVALQDAETREQERLDLVISALAFEGEGDVAVDERSSPSLEKELRVFELSNLVHI